MGWFMLAVTIVIAVAGTLGLRRFLVRRYRELYGHEDPPYEDPPVLPNLPGPSGGLS